MGEKRTSLIIGAVIVTALVVIGGWVLTLRPGQPEIPLTYVTERSEIEKILSLDHISIATSENFAGQRIRLIYGVLKNLSAKPVRLVEVRMVFQSVEEKSIQEESPKVFDTRQRPLAPGEEFRFEVAFENLPKDWNYRVPLADISRIGY